jgi:glucokinase
LKRVVLVNGLPASGKTMAARAIVEATGWPLLTLDSIKEPFFDELGLGDRAWNRSLGRAAYAAMWTIIADAAPDATFVLDAWFGFQPIDVLLGHMTRATVRTAVEIWCHAPGNVLADRYLSRVAERHPGHPGAAYAPELAARADQVAALGRFPVYDHESTQPLDAAALIAWVHANLDGPDRSDNRL